MDYSRARPLLVEIAARHKAAWDSNDSRAMARTEEEALIVCNAFDVPVTNPNLMLASYWPHQPMPDPL